LKKSKKIIKIVFSVLLFYAAITLVFSADILSRYNYISNQLEIQLVIISYLLAALSFYLVANMIPKKYNIIKFLLYFWSGGSILFSSMYFAYFVIKMMF